ncbi:hypothetical protein [Aeromonas media]|uniref:hypothetical protein n=1 Tax=Aeromonas media TaxID=651 RepID=UPI002952FB11|nr:hypothetical protein [Aeromonas media]WOQ12725.1 hypothetical protein R2X36_17880 [Aeromonas media]
MNDLKGKVEFVINDEVLVVNGDDFGWEAGGDSHYENGERFITPAIFKSWVESETAGEVEIQVVVHENGRVEAPFIAAASVAKVTKCTLKHHGFRMQDDD